MRRAIGLWVSLETRVVAHRGECTKWNFCDVDPKQNFGRDGPLSEANSNFAAPSSFKQTLLTESCERVESVSGTESVWVFQYCG